MATNNSIDSLDPIQVALGGTGNSSLTQYGVLYGNGTSVVGVTAVGSTSQVLLSNGSGMSPTFQSVSGSISGWNFIASQTASSSASLSFTSAISTTYYNYIVILDNVVPATNTAVLYMTYSINGGSSYINSGYYSGINFWAYNSGTTTNNNASAQFLCSAALSNTSSIGICGMIWLLNLTSGVNPSVYGNVCFNGSTSGNGSMGLMNGIVTTGSINAIQFSMSSGNIASGTIKLYGLARS